MVWTDLGRVRGGRKLLSEFCESHSDQCEPGEEGFVAVLSTIVSIMEGLGFEVWKYLGNSSCHDL